MGIVPQRAAEQAESVVVRLRRELDEAGLECGCRERAEEVLVLYGREQALESKGAALAQMRHMRDAIVLVTVLLGEVDRLTPEEPDLSAFAELADLFSDIAEFAEAGAEAARQVAPADTTTAFERSRQA